MNTIRIRRLDRTEETLSAREAREVMGGGPYLVYGSSYPVYPAYPAYPAYPTYPVIGAPYAPALYNPFVSPFYPAVRIYTQPVVVSPYYRVW
jgi:hypothetical protein